MTDASDDKRDFFVSFNKADRSWATWIAWVLEEAGYAVFFQDWDFRGSFIEQMHQANLRTGRTLVVLSDHYLGSEYARSEAWAALARDPSGHEDRVVIVKVGPTGNLGLFSHFAYLDLTTSVEADAERLLLERVRKAVEPDYRAKPPTRPGFPGGAKRKVPEKPSFPGVIHPDFVRGLLRYPVTYIQELIDLVSGPKRLIAQRRVEGTLTLGRALRFLAFSSLIIWTIPFHAKLSFSFANDIPSDILLNIVELASYSLALVFAWRVVGGRVKLFDYLPIIVYYSAIFKFIILIGNIVNLGAFLMYDEQLYEAMIEQVRRGTFFPPSPPVWEKIRNAPLLIMVILSIPIIIEFSWFVAGWGAYRELNHASRQRSALAALIFFSLHILIVGLLGLIVSALLRAHA